MIDRNEEDIPVASTIQKPPMGPAPAAPMKTVIILPDGVGIRNFLCTSFVEKMQKAGTLVFVHGLTDGSIETHRKRLAGTRWSALPSYRETPLERLLRQAKLHVQLEWFARKERSANARRMYGAPRSLRNHLVHDCSRLLAQIGSGGTWAQRLDRWHERQAGFSSSTADCERDLREMCPDIVFCTHQRASMAVPMMTAARKLGIPTATFIYSWDNLPKGRMAVPADAVLVWSEYMKREYLTYYPEKSETQVYVTGTPQFEPYFNTSFLLSKEEFCTRHGLDPARPILCFSGDDLSTSPYDQEYLQDTAGAVRSLPAKDRPQILFRRCPVDVSRRYDAALERNPEIRVSDPVWRSDGTDAWTRIIPTLDDVALLANVVEHCDAVINVGSTMAIDFSIKGKPGIFFNYNPPATDGRWRIEHIYALPHFQPIHDLKPFYWVDCREDLAGVIGHAVRNPREKEKQRRDLLNLLVEHPLDKAGERIAGTLHRIASKRIQASCTSLS